MFGDVVKYVILTQEVICKLAYVYAIKKGPLSRIADEKFSHLHCAFNAPE